MPPSGHTRRGRPSNSQYAKSAAEPAATRGRSRTKSTPANQVPPANDKYDTQSQQDTLATDDHIAARIDTMLSAAIEKAVPQLAARLGQLAGPATPNTSARRSRTLPKRSINLILQKPKQNAPARVQSPLTLVTPTPFQTNMTQNQHAKSAKDLSRPSRRK